MKTRIKELIARNNLTQENIDKKAQYIIKTLKADPNKATLFIKGKSAPDGKKIDKKITI